MGKNWIIVRICLQYRRPGFYPFGERSSGGGQPPPVFLLGESHGQRSLAACSPWGCKELERLSTAQVCHSFPSKEQMSLNFMDVATVHSDFRAQENKICHCFYFFPFCLLWNDWTGCHHLSFLMLSFKPAFSLSSFTLIKRLFGSSSLFAIRVVKVQYINCILLKDHWMVYTDSEAVSLLSLVSS